MERKVAFYTLGCKLNFSETSTISRQFESQGFKKVAFEDTPNVFVINTCSVTDNADKKCKKIVKDALSVSPDAYVIIIGCYAQLKPVEIAEIPGVDAVLGAKEKFNLFEHIHDFIKVEETKVLNSDIEIVEDYHTSYSIDDRTRTFLKVQDGCDYPCTYCTIPLARGKSRSGTIIEVIEKANEIASKGIKEIVLTGVNIGDFGIINGKKESSFFELIQELDKVKGIERIRISSIEPNLLSNEIIDFVSNSDKIVPHFHIPLQSGSDKVLKLMRRRYLSNLYVERVNYIKEKMPNACIGVDVIVGFPGETEEEFQKTYDFIHQLPVSYLHVFTYSERDNTKALELNEIVPLNERKVRSKMLRSLSSKKRSYFYSEQLKKESTVLIETIENGIAEGFTDNYVKVEIPSEGLISGETHKVKTLEILPSGNVSALIVK